MPTGVENANWYNHFWRLRQGAFANPDELTVFPADSGADLARHAQVV
jgi:hypothetical protein